MPLIFNRADVPRVSIERQAEMAKGVHSLCQTVSIKTEGKHQNPSSNS